MPPLSEGIQPTAPDCVGSQADGTELLFEAAHSDRFPNVRLSISHGLAVATFGSAAGISVASACESEMGGGSPLRKLELPVAELVARRSTPLAYASVVALVSTPAESASRRTTRPVARPIPRAVSAERPGRRRTASHA